MKNKRIVRLDGCQVTKIIKDHKGHIESALLKLGELLYMPLGSEHAWRLEEKDSGIEVFEGSGTHKNYFLNVEGLYLEDEYKHFSQLIGVDLRSELFSFAITDDNEWKQARYSCIKEELNIKEW